MSDNPLTPHNLFAIDYPFEQVYLQDIYDHMLGGALLREIYPFFSLSGKCTNVCAVLHFAGARLSSISADHHGQIARPTGF